jgi:hypothetical protein
MLGRKDYTEDELARARAAVDQQLATSRRLASAATAASEPDTVAELERRFR